MTLQKIWALVVSVRERILASEDHGHQKFPQIAFTAQCAVFDEVLSKKNLQLCAVRIERIQFEGIFCDRKFTPPRCLANSNIG